MIAIFLSPLYFFGTWLLTFMFLRWLSVCSEKGRLRRFFKRKTVRFAGYFITFCISLFMPVGFLMDSGRVKYSLLHLGSIWLGILMCSLMIAFLYLLYCLVWRIVFEIRKKKKKINKTEEYIARRPARIAAVAGAVSLVAIILICGYGIYNSTNVRTTEYTININKDSKLGELNAVMAADLHLGYNIGCSAMRKMVDEINACKPDIVFIAGDIFDNDIRAIDNPVELAGILASIDSRYGVYACYGNHDIDEKILAGFTFDYDGVKVSDPAMDEFLKLSGIQLLMDEGVLIDDSFYVYGRPDYAKPGRGIEGRKTPAMIAEEIRNTYPGKDYPVIVLDHEPKESVLLSKNGFDLVLSGHTHDGQIFPANILVSMLYDNSYGYKKYDGLQEIVTSGVGFFGPCMRIGTVSEICNVKIRFEK